MGGLGAVVIMTTLLAGLTASLDDEGWRCPDIDDRPAAECSCDLPHTLRCAGDATALATIGRHLKTLRMDRRRVLSSKVSLLDCSLRGVPVLTNTSLLELTGSSLYGLVISSGDLKSIQNNTFNVLADSLQALGLSSNQLTGIPTQPLSKLKKMDRLDLSHNRIKILIDNSFLGIENLTYLDLSDNIIKDMAEDCLMSLRNLKILRMRGNHLSVSSLSALKHLRSLEELDLSGNGMIGPLGPNTVPGLKNLQSLQMNDNSLTSIRRGALAGLTNLTFLGLHNNQIDVIEDHAFRQLANLTDLDLAHNGIVAISSNSLAHLVKLERLDLSHNFLRSLSAEPLRPLKRLKELMLHDNDISMVDSGSLDDHRQLRRLTMVDNPLNCDCFIAGFAKWLQTAPNLQKYDLETAVCVTPPQLEGALLYKVNRIALCEEQGSVSVDKKVVMGDSTTPKSDTITEAIVDIEPIDVITKRPKPDRKIPNIRNTINLLREDVTESVKSKPGTSKISQRVIDEVNVVENSMIEESLGVYDDNAKEESESPLSEDLPVSDSKVSLESFTYDGKNVRLKWKLPSGNAGQYSCDGIFVYEMTGSKERLLRADPVRCSGESSVSGEGRIETVMSASETLLEGKSYRFCVALLEETSPDSDDLSLVLGCSEVLPLRSSSKATTKIPLDNRVRVSGVKSNVTSSGLLTVEVSLAGFPPQNLQLPSLLRPQYSNPITNCYVTLAVFCHGSLVAQRDTHCENNILKMDGFVQESCTVCATVSDSQVTGPNSVCVKPQLVEAPKPMEMKVSVRAVNAVVVGSSLALVVAGLAIAWAVRKLFSRPKLCRADCRSTRQCCSEELAVRSFEGDQNSGYVKLKATSNV